MAQHWRSALAKVCWREEGEWPAQLLLEPIPLGILKVVHFSKHAQGSLCEGGQSKGHYCFFIAYCIIAYTPVAYGVRLSSLQTPMSHSWQSPTPQPGGKLKALCTSLLEQGSRARSPVPQCHRNRKKIWCSSVYVPSPWPACTDRVRLHKCTHGKGKEPCISTKGTVVKVFRTVIRRFEGLLHRRCHSVIGPKFSELHSDISPDIFFFFGFLFNYVFVFPKSHTTTAVPTQRPSQYV